MTGFVLMVLQSLKTVNQVNYFSNNITHSWHMYILITSNQLIHHCENYHKQTKMYNR